jgi:hypothetical protein
MYMKRRSQPAVFYCYHHQELCRPYLLFLRYQVQPAVLGFNERWEKKKNSSCKMAVEKPSLKDGKKFTGKDDKGLTWEAFNKKVVSWCREKYGAKYGNALWKEELLDLHDLKLTDDEDFFDFVSHITTIYDLMSEVNPRHADGLWSSERFWTIKWQLEHRQRQREKLYTFLESICGGEAARQVEQLGVERQSEMRDHLFTRFGGGANCVVEG